MFIGRDDYRIPVSKDFPFWINPRSMKLELLKVELEDIAKEINADLKKEGWTLLVTVEKDASRINNKGYTLKISGEIGPKNQYSTIPFSIERAREIVGAMIEKHLPDKHLDKYPTISVYKDDSVYVVNHS